MSVCIKDLIQNMNLVVGCDIGCAYCYANYSQGSIKANCEKHDPESAVLIGTCSPEDLPFKKDQKSFFTGPLEPEQMQLL